MNPNKKRPMTSFGRGAFLQRFKTEICCNWELSTDMCACETKIWPVSASFLNFFFFLGEKWNPDGSSFYVLSLSASPSSYIIVWRVLAISPDCFYLEINVFFFHQEKVVWATHDVHWKAAFIAGMNTTCLDLQGLRRRTPRWRGHLKTCYKLDPVWW